MDNTNTIYNVHYYTHPDWVDDLTPANGEIPAHSHYAHEHAVVLAHAEPQHGGSRRYTLAMVNGSLCLNALDDIPDAVNFDAYAAESVMAFIASNNPKAKRLHVIGWATFNPATSKYELQK